MAVRLPEVFNAPVATPTPVSRNTDYGGGSAVGRAWAGVGETIAKGAAKAREEIDNLQAESALNKLRARELELTRGEAGYTNINGGDVVATDMIGSYTKKYESAVSEIESELPTEQQRAKFRLRADAASTAFKSGLYSHASRQIDVYEKNMIEGAIDIEASSAMVNWNNPAAVADSTSRIRALTVGYSTKQGMSPEASLQLSNRALSSVHSGVVTGALQNGDVDAAAKYLSENKGEMEVSAVSTLGIEIQKRQQAKILNTVRSDISNMLERKVSPSGSTLLNRVVRQLESGGRSYTPSGAPLTSATGAKYDMQVLPSTARDPGFGIRPAAEDSPKEWNRVGDELLEALTKKYDGNIAMTLAAYNVGSGAVDRAIAAGGDNWFEKLTTIGEGAIIPPNQAKQVDGYVRKGTKMMNTGSGYEPLPTVSELKRSVRESMKGQPDELIAKAEVVAEATLNDVKASQRQQIDEAMQELDSLVEAGQLMDPDAIPMELAARLGPELPKARRFVETQAERVTEMSPVAADFYYDLRMNREKLAEMSAGEILALAPDIGRARAKNLIERKEAYEADPDMGTSAAMDTDQFLTIARQFGYSNDSTKKRAVLVSVKDRAEEAIIDAEKSLGRKLSREEKGQVLRRMFTTVRTERENTGWLHRLTGYGPDKKVQAVPVYKLTDQDSIVVPPEARAAILAAGKKAGVSLTERDIREEYLLRLTDQQQEERK